MKNFYPVGTQSYLWYSRGYQAAMVDIARIVREDQSLEAVRLWVEDNTIVDEVVKGAVS